MLSFPPISWEHYPSPAQNSPCGWWYLVLLCWAWSAYLSLAWRVFVVFWKPLLTSTSGYRPSSDLTHESGTVDVHHIPTPRDDEVDHMPVSGTSMHPSGQNRKNMSRQAQTICPCSGWSKDVRRSIQQPPLMLPQCHSFLVRICSPCLRFCQEPVPQGSGLQVCMAGASNSVEYCNTWATTTPAYHHLHIVNNNNDHSASERTCMCDFSHGVVATWTTSNLMFWMAKLSERPWLEGMA